MDETATREPAATTGTPRPPMLRRLAAAGALLAFFGAIAILAWGLARHPVQLPISLILLFITLASAWSALVNRGLLRVFCTVIALVALFLILVLPDARSYAIFASVVGLMLVATTAARYAIGHDLVPTVHAHSVPPARHGVLIMNPWSGGGKVREFHLEGEARKLGVTPVLLHHGDDLRALAEKAIADGADVIGMAGGDGSQALVADVARQHNVPFVCVPAGTRNHFALDLGLDRNNVAAALAAYGAARERRVDLALLGDRVFVNNASLGVYATVVQSKGYRDAKLATTAQMLPDLLGPHAERFDLHYARPDGVLAESADVLMVSNGAYRLGSLGGFGTRQRMDSGVLGVVSITVDRARDVPALVSAEATGRISYFRGYAEWTTARFEVESSASLVDVGVDGEALRLAPPLVFRSLPRALRVRIPPSAGVAPAAMAPAGAWRTISAVALVLVGKTAR
jgi:diacylglycerol kinase family enzyme